MRNPRKCSHCGEEMPERQILRAAASIQGARGKGEAKARTSEQARAAINARWARVRAAKQPPPS